MKKSFKALIIITSFLAVSCSNFGEEKDFNGVQLYYTPEITSSQVDKLGAFLIEGEFADGEEKTVQITKKDSIYEFRMVIKEDFVIDSAMENIFRLFGQELSENVFNYSKVDLHACDAFLNTTKVFPMFNFGKSKTFTGIKLYYSPDFTENEIKLLGDYLVTSGFSNEKGEILVQILKGVNGIEFKMVAAEGAEQIAENVLAFSEVATELSKNVFNNEHVDFHTCDDYFNTVMVFPMTSK